MAEKIPMTIWGAKRGGTYMCDEVIEKPGMKIGIIKIPLSEKEKKEVKDRIAEIIGNSLGMKCTIID